MIHWTQEMEDTMKKKYHKVKNKQLARELGIAQSTLLVKADKLGLKKRKYTIGNKKPSFGPVPEHKLEVFGRKKMFELEGLRNKIEINKRLKIQDYINQSVGYIKKYGRVIGKTNNFIVIKCKNYTECFKYSDILIGKTILEEY